MSEPKVEKEAAAQRWSVYQRRSDGVVVSLLENAAVDKDKALTLANDLNALNASLRIGAVTWVEEAAQ